jgi:putative transposase
MGDPPRSEGGTAVKSNVPVVEAINDGGVLPERVQEALGQLVGAAKEGLLALSVEVGLGVLVELLEQEVEAAVGPRGKWNPDRTAVRHGHENGEVTLGGRRVQVRRPRARTADGESEVPLKTYEHFAERDQLEGVVLERMLAGVSTRGYRRAQEPVGPEVETDARSTWTSAVSRTFVHRTRQLLWNLMRRPLADLRLAVIMLDGIELHGRTNIVALGITTGGEKLALGVWDGSTENAAVASALLSDLVDGGLDVEQGMLFVIDGSEALRKAIRQVFGNDVPVQRCVQHKLRNVVESISPNATANRSSSDYAELGRRPTTTARSSSSTPSQSNSTTPTPGPPPRSGRAWRRRCPSPASGTPASSSSPSSRPTRASR